MEEKEMSKFQKNISRRLVKKLLFSSEEKVRNMYDRRDWIEGYLKKMPLVQDKDNEMAAKGSLQELKRQYITYWSKVLNLEEERQEGMSEIWDAGMLGKYDNPDIGRAVIYFHDGRKMTEEAFLSVMIQTFRL